MKNILIVLFTFILLTLLSCEEATPPVVNNGIDTTLTQDYFIYYPMSQSRGWRPEHAGLFRDTYGSANPVERLVTTSTIVMSKVAKNGTVVFVQDEGENELWVRYKDGTTQKIPLPQSPDNKYAYRLDIGSSPELSYNGNLLVYFATMFSKTNETLPTNIQKMITVELPSMTTKIYDLKEFYQSAFQNDGFDIAEPSGSQTLINDDGSVIYFVLEGKDDASSYPILGYSLVKLDNAVLSKYGNTSTSKILLNGFDLESNKIYCKVNGEQKYIKNGGLFENSNLPYNSLFYQHQFQYNKSVVVLGDENGISLYDTKTESLIKTVITWDSLEKASPLLTYKATPYISISPDGGLIVFALHPKNDTQSYTLFAIRKDGKGLKQVVMQTPLGNPVVSYGFKK